MVHQLLRNSADNFIAADQSHQRRRKVAQGFHCRILCCGWAPADRLSDRCDKTIAASGDRGDVPVTALAVRERAAQLSNMELEIAFDHEGMGPNLCDQLRLADQLAGTFDEGDQEIESATAETHGRVPFQQQPLCREQPEGTKGNLVIDWVIRSINRFDLSLQSSRFVIRADMICSSQFGAAARRRCLQTACRFVTCRRHCRGPFAFGMERDSRPGTPNRSSKEKKRSAITRGCQRIV